MAVTGYSAKQIWLHWALALLIIIQFVLHDGILAVSDAIAKGEEPAMTLIARSHIILGIVIFLLALYRVYIRLTRGAPPAPADEPAILRFLAGATHVVLYAILLIMPLSGAASWFGGIEAASTGHFIQKFILLAFFLLHFVGALYQRFILKTDVMQRMMQAEK